MLRLFKRAGLLADLFFAGTIFTATFLPGYLSAAFLDPVYEVLDEAVLRSRFDAARAKGTSLDIGDLEAAFFFHDRLVLDLKVHEAQKVDLWLGEACDQGEADRFRVYAKDLPQAWFICAMVSAERVETSSPWTKSSRIQQALDRYAKGAAASGDSSANRLYAEGRVFLRLPELPGFGLGKGLLALQFLTRLEPEKSSPFYYLSKGYERSQNLAAFELWRARAIAKNDSRAKLEYARSARLRRLVNDGFGSGFAPSFFTSPQGGFGLAGSYSQQRWGDRDRSLNALGFATSRGQWGAEAALTEFELLAPTGLVIDFHIFRGEQDNFAVGPGSDLSSRFVPQLQREEMKLGVVQPFSGDWSLGLGWHYFHQTAFDAASPARLAALPSGPEITYSGPYFELGYDNRDSAVAPRSGHYVQLAGFFSGRGLLSTRSFERWRGQAGIYFRGLMRTHVVSIRSVLHWVSGEETPWAAFPKVSSPLTGVREGRYIDRALWGNTGEYRFPLGLGFGAHGFINVASVNQSVPQALSGNYSLGGGGGLHWLSDFNRSASWQINVGRFGDEWNITASGGVMF